MSDSNFYLCRLFRFNGTKIGNFLGVVCFLLQIIQVLLFLRTKNTKFSDDWFARKYYVSLERVTKNGL